jgi:flagellar hook-associated protein 3 FlgL
MRVTQANAFDRSVQNLQQRQQGLTDAQARLTSGKRVERASDDPTQAARAERARAAHLRAEVSERALEASRNVMALSEGALGDAVDLVQQARELMVQAGSPALADGQRATIASSLRAIREQLLLVANRSDGDKGFVFAGQGASQPPFLDTASGVQFRGTPGLLMAAADEPLPLSVDGSVAWMRNPRGNGVFETSQAPGNSGRGWIDAGRVTNPGAVTGDEYEVVFTSPSTYSLLRNGSATAVVNAPYVAGQAIEFDGQAIVMQGAPQTADRFISRPSAPTGSVFEALNAAADELALPNRDPAQRAQAVTFGLRDLDSALGQLSAARSALGEAMNRGDVVGDRLADAKLVAKQEQSSAEDLDLVAAISEFQNRQAGYDAALKTYSMVQRMSLFDYMR